MPDAEDITAWLAEWDVARMLVPVPHPYRLDDAERWRMYAADRRI
jgi:hypothetical protein